MSDKKELALVTQYKEEINRQLADPETMKSLMDITFKGLTPQLAKRAMLEGYMRGFTFINFLNKDIYAIPFVNRRVNPPEETYTLITSIDYVRKKTRDVGLSAPTFTYYDGGKIDACSITAKRTVGDTISEWTATVFFEEYDTKKNLWVTKPKTMIAKVAEAHARRMAAPEELSKLYVEEEFEKENAREGTYQVVRTVHEDEDEEKPNLLIHQNSRQVDESTAAELEDKTIN
jgi:RecT family